MKKPNCSLYLVTDRSLLNGTDLCEAIEMAIDGGVTMVQLREKSLTSREFYSLAQKVVKLTNRWNVPLIINDRLDIALAAGADGVHLGQKDIPIGAARRISGSSMIIGASAATVDEAVEAEQAGADYIGVGALFPTSTKKDTRPVTVELLREIKKSVSIPVAAIGGIDENNAKLLIPAGIDGIAVVSAILGSSDIRAAARQMALESKCLI